MLYWLAYHADVFLTRHEILSNERTGRERVAKPLERLQLKAV